nr:beta-ketoacyl-ACP synthase [Luteibacter sp. Sphag1AF]
MNALGVVCALGQNKSSVAEALFAGERGGVRSTPGWMPARQVALAHAPHTLNALPAGTATWRDNRNNRLLLAAARDIEVDVRDAVSRFGASRIGVVIGSSTTGIEDATRAIAQRERDGEWPADYHYAHQELGAPAAVLADHFQLSGPAYGISTACTSSARAMLSARRLLRMGVCDAVICGGADTLCRLAIHGFHALEAVDSDTCRPFSRERGGINIGEAAALFLMTREPARVELAGGGASSDAWHLSSPDPQGHGALQAMERALASAGIAAHAIDYINLHGTATEHNDAMESIAVARLFGQVPCSSTKAITGHTLGAAGALEAAFCWLSLNDTAAARRLPPHVWDGLADAALPALRFTDASSRLPEGGRRYLMSNSFAFGGNNASLILADAA